MEKFSDRLKTQRKLSGLTQKAIAEKLNVSKVAVSRWELGHSIPKGKVLTGLADILRCSAEWLLNGSTSCEGVVFLKYFDDVKASAGNGYLADENSATSIAVPKDVVVGRNLGDLCCLKITGTSMEPVLWDGAIIAIDLTKKTVRDGMLYVVRQGDLLRIKLLIEKPHDLIIRSFNPAFEDEIYKKQDLEDFAIIGEVFWYSSHINIK